MKIEIKKPDTNETADMQACPIWEKEVSTFSWVYDANETCLIIEGEVKVTPDGGGAVLFGPGDLVTFPKGMKCTWEITSPVRKYYRFF